MLSKKILAVGLLCCFFENIQGGLNREQLEKKLGKPVHSFTLVVDFAVTDHWFYTTELSKILLVGEGPVIETCRLIPFFGSSLVPIILPIISPIIDNRFEDFVGNVDKCSQQQLRAAVQDTLLLTGGSNKAYSMSSLLKHLEDTLQNKIDLIQDQIKFDFTYDQESVCSMKKSLAFAAGLIAVMSVANTYIKPDDKNVDVEALHSLAVLGMLPVSYQILKNSYGMLTKDPHAHNQYLKKYQDLLEFVQSLSSELKTDGSITFELDNGNTAIVKEYDMFPFSPGHTLNFD